MHATADVTRALAEWRRLTDLEGEAIINDDWPGSSFRPRSSARLLWFAPPLPTRFTLPGKWNVGLVPPPMS